ncbi:MAG TPA: hypothetical protein VHB48_02520 [Chitinophagaceae bacterium]|nr:hypothetical protein [Chitinophagaceae bacterium]
MFFAIQPLTKADILFKKIGAYESCDVPGISKHRYNRTNGRQPKKLAAQQVIAGNAFKLFGLDNMPVYKIDTSFMQEADVCNQVGESGLLADLWNTHETLQNGTIHQNNVSDYVSELLFAAEDKDVLAFSKISGNKETVILYNTSATEPKEKFVLLNSCKNDKIKQLHSLYGFNTEAQFPLYKTCFRGNALCYMKIYLRPLQFVILNNY